MVRGLASFKEWFKGYEEQYTIDLEQLGVIGRSKEEILEELLNIYYVL